MIDEATPAVTEDATPAADTPADTGAAVPAAGTREENHDAMVAEFKKAVESVTPKAEVKDDAPPAAVEAKPAPIPAEPAKADAAPPVVADPKAAIDAEVAKLNEELRASGHKPLTKASEERFRKMATELAERPTKDAIEKEYAPVVQQAQRMSQWDDVVRQSTATGEEIQNALGFIQATKSGDPKRELQAADALLEAVKQIYQRNGKELPGMVDPLQGHADLSAAVENGMDRKDALRIAQERAALSRTQDTNKRLTDEQSLHQATQRAAQDVDALNDQLKAADPQFAQKLQFLIPTLRVIKQTMHPSQWVPAIKDAYLAIPAIPAPAPIQAAPVVKPPVGPVPVRPTGNAVPMRQAVPTDPLAAFKHGIERLSA